MKTGTSAKKSAAVPVNRFEHQWQAAKGFAELRRKSCIGVRALCAVRRIRSGAPMGNGLRLSAQESQAKRSQRAEPTLCSLGPFAAWDSAAAPDDASSSRAISLFHKSRSVRNLAGMFQFFAGGVKGFAVFRARMTGTNTERRFSRGNGTAVRAWDGVQLFFLNSNASPRAVTLMRSPGLNSPSSSLMESGSSNFSWMLRLSGRAPNCGS